MSKGISSNLFDLPKKAKTAAAISEPEAEDFVNGEKPREPTARLSVDVPHAMLKRIKMHAVERDLTVREVVLRLFEREGFGPAR